MGKNRSASGLTNIIQYDDSGNITFVSGSTTLMSVSSSGAITTTGTISGSNVQSASLALNSNLLQGTGSVGFTTTGSFTTMSGSVSSRVSQIETVYATTGSNSFRATQSITGSLTVTGQIIAQTLNVQQVTSSIVYSSGSNVFGCDINSRQTFTGSFYQTGSSANFSGIIYGGSDVLLLAANPVIYGGTAAGGVSISNNTGGSYIKIFGACHTTTPNVTSFINGNSTTLTLNANNTATFTNTVTATSYNACGNYYARYGAGDRMAFIFSEDYYFGMTNPSDDVRALKITAQALDGISTIQFYTGNNCERMRISCAGNVGIGVNNPQSQLHLNGTITFTQPGFNAVRLNQIASQHSDGSSPNNFIRFLVSDGSGVTCERMRVNGSGNFGINCSSPGYTIDVNGNAHFRADGGTMLIESTSPTNSSTLRIIQCATGGNGNTDQGLVVQTNAADGTSNIANFYDYNNGSPVSRVRFLRNGVVCFNNTICSPAFMGGTMSGTLLTSTTHRLGNSTGNFANMVHKVYGAAGSFSSLVICVNLAGAGGYGYIINSGGTNGGVFQSGGGYTNGQANFSHSAPVGSGFTITCHACAGTENIIRFVGAGGVHPFVSIQMFGSLQQFINDDSFYIAYS